MNHDPKNQWTLGGYLPFILEGTYTPPTGSEDERWMSRALIEGMKGAGISNPNPSVGCVIVQDNQEIAAGATEAYKDRHAERVAVDTLGSLSNLSGCTAYLTLEPCSHQGHQPPCVDLLIEKKVSRVVIACPDPNPKVSGEGIAKLRAYNIPVTLGVLNQAAQMWHFPFLAYHQLGRPILIGKWAQTPQGLLADDEGKSKWISNPKVRAYGHWLRHKYDAVAVGAGTVLADCPRLTVRDCALPVLRQPLRIILDPRSRIKDITPQLAESTFSPEGKTVVIADSKDAVQSLIEWINSTEAAQVFGKPLQSVFIEGGAQLLNLFLTAKTLDALHVVTGTKEFSGTKHRIYFNSKSEEFTAVGEYTIEGDVLREYVRSGTLPGPFIR